MRAEIITIREQGSSVPTPATESGITGVVLAGGAGSRFAGADKGLLRVGGRTLVKRVLEQLLLQVRDIVIVANRNQALYAGYGYRVVSDKLPGHQGPLAGIAAGLEAIQTSHALFVPVDAARLPPNLSASLVKAHVENGRAPCFVRSHDRPMPTCCLLPRSARAAVEAALAAGKRDPLEWLREQRAVEVEYRDWPREFWGIESPQQMRPLEKALSR